MVNSVQSFLAKNIEVCVMNKPAHTVWIKSMFPELSARNLIRVINGSTGTSLMQAIQGRECSGGIAPDVHVRYALGPADPECELAQVMPISQNLNTGYYAIPFGLDSPNAPSEFVLALGYLFIVPLQSNNYQARQTRSPIFAEIAGTQSFCRARGCTWAPLCVLLTFLHGPYAAEVPRLHRLFAPQRYADTQFPPNSKARAPAPQSCLLSSPPQCVVRFDPGPLCRALFRFARHELSPATICIAIAPAALRIHAD